jgi:CRISPR-associated endonuclease/helicase Cas3
MTFDEFFKTATEYGSYPFQKAFAEAKDLYRLVDVPTGLGKTAMAVLGWLWRRRHHPDKSIREMTPRRLVYCLPMRVLVEQTRDNAELWLHNLEILGGEALFEERDGKKRPTSYTPDFRDPDKVTIHILMGGEEKTDWAMWPEREMILIGTQDMLLSRALNRGYAAGRARWPMEFGLLNNDSFWVFDEIQLMGPGLAATTQLEAFRHLLGSKDGDGCHSLWMSATLRRDWLRTVDFDLSWLGEPLKLTDEDSERVASLWDARKPLQPANAGINDPTSLATKILKCHKPGTRTIVVVNTVRRACDLYEEIAERWGSEDGQCLVLLHSRFRPEDRKAQVGKVLAAPAGEGTIIISTQVIEAGVDISAATLFTELAPWASLVQRFGRCNRKGEENQIAEVHWIDLANEDAAPYEPEDLDKARQQLRVLRDVGLRSLNAHPVELSFEHTHVIRKKDLIDLFDTTPDLAGNDIDIDRFIRGIEETDVRVFWRDYGEMPNETNDKNAETAPHRKELCPAPVGEFKKFADDAKRKGKVWRWDFLEKRWDQADTARIAPGQVYLVHADAGGYVADHGWDPQSSKRVEPVTTADETCASESYEDDRYSRTDTWQTVAEHTEAVCSQLDAIVGGLSVDSSDALRHAARWHDRGKVHEVFVKALPDAPPTQGGHWAKAPGAWKRYGRRHFRHELASALAVLDPANKEIPDELRDLIAYLVAAHHGKVRLSIRSMPNETRPPMDGSRFARGVWDGDILPETDLGGGIVAPEVRLSLEPMGLGLCEQEPFKGRPSWADRMIGLRETLGPFRLAYLEALLRVADRRASQTENHP